MSDDRRVLVRRGSGDGMGAKESRRISREGQVWPARVAERPVRVTSAEQRGLRRDKWGKSGE